MASIESFSARESRPDVNIAALRDSIDRSFGYLMFQAQKPRAYPIDRYTLYSALEQEGLSLPKILTNNPLNNELTLLVGGRRGVIYRQTGNSRGRHKSILDTRVVSLNSSNEKIDEMNPLFVYRLTLGGTPVVTEGFQDYKEVNISQMGKTVRPATAEDLRLADILLKSAVMHETS